MLDTRNQAVNEGYLKFMRYKFPIDSYFHTINSSGVNKHVCQMALRQLNTLNKADVHVDGNDCERLCKAHKDNGCIRIHRHMRS